MSQVRAGDVKTAYHPDDLTFDKIRHDWKHEQIVLHKQFQCSIQGIVRREGLNVAPHQVFGQDKGMKGRGLRRRIDLIKCHHSQQSVVGIDHGQDGIRGTAESFNDSGERILRMQHQCG